MLTVEARFMIRQLHDLGWSISAIACQTGHDRRTIRKAAQGPLVSEPKPRKPSTHKIDLCVDYLQKRLDEGVWNACKLYTEI